MTKTLYFAIAFAVATVWQPLISPAQVLDQPTLLSNLEQDIKNLLENVKPSIVTVEVQSKWDMVLSDRTKKSSVASQADFVGSGIILNDSGFVLTSANVIETAFSDITLYRKDLKSDQKYRIILSDGRKVPAKYIGRDDETNLAILKIDATNLKPARLGNSEDLKVGSWITVVGNSYGVPSGVTFGLVNGFRSDGSIQMSVNVAPGSSGGPVLNTKGEVVGLVLAKISEPFSVGEVVLRETENKQSSKTIVIPGRQIDLPTSGVSLAVPINKVRDVAHQILTKGSVNRAYVGVYPQDLDSDLKESLNIEEGCLIADVIEDGPADRAGLKSGDVVTAINDAPIRNEASFRRKIASLKPDTDARCKVNRKGKELEIVITLGEKGEKAITDQSWQKWAQTLGRGLGQWRILEPKYPEYFELKDIPTETADLKKQVKELEKNFQALRENIELQQKQLQELMKELQELSRVREPDRDN